MEWVIGKEMMAVKVNGELSLISNHYGYIKAFEKNPGYSLSSPVAVASNSTMTMETLRVTEIQ